MTWVVAIVVVILSLMLGGFDWVIQWAAETVLYHRSLRRMSQ